MGLVTENRVGDRLIKMIFLAKIAGNSIKHFA